MDRFKTWALRLGLLGALFGALFSRDACLGGSHPPPPAPSGSQPAAVPATASPAPSAAPSGTFASPP